MPTSVLFDACRVENSIKLGFGVLSIGVPENDGRDVSAGKMIRLR